MFEQNKVGMILNGKYKGWYILIKPIETGGFFTYIMDTHPDKGLSSQGYDDYMINKDSVELQIEDEGWIINWNLPT